nr:hypothetical protein [Tanacetum cinerariifolium]
MTEEEQLVAAMKKALKDIKKADKIQQQSAGSSEGASIILEVSNEPKGSSVAKDDAEADWGSESKSDKSEEKDFNEGEVEWISIDDEEKMMWQRMMKRKHKRKKDVDEEQTRDEQSKDNQAEDDQPAPLLDVLVSVIPEQPTPPPTTTKAQVDPVPESEAFIVVLQRLFEMEKQVKELKQVDHSEFILQFIKNQVPTDVFEFIKPRLKNTI